MKMNRWIKWALLTLAGTFVLVLVLVGAAAVFLSVRGVETIPLGTAEGQALLRGQDGPDYGPLKQNHVAQLRMHCYAASAAIVMNSLQPGEGYTQTNLFAPETADIITEDQLDDALFTLQKLVDIIHARSGLQADPFHAGSGESEHGYAELVQRLKENQRNPDDQIIITYSLGYLALGGGLGDWVDTEGHASPVAAYNEQSDMVLMLEVDGTKEPFWIKSADIYGAMNTLDPVSGQHRGWARVAREQPPESS